MSNPSVLLLVLTLIEIDKVDISKTAGCVIKVKLLEESFNLNAWHLKKIYSGRGDNYFFKASLIAF